MVSKRKYITSLENTVESQRVIINDLLDRNNKLISLALTHINNTSAKHDQMIQQQIQQQQQQHDQMIKHRQEQDIREHDSFVDFIIDKIPDKLQKNMTVLEYVTFGLINIYGKQYSKKILKTMANNRAQYLIDKNKLKYLLIMYGSSDEKVDMFINWLRDNKDYCKFPVGLLLDND